MLLEQTLEKLTGMRLFAMANSLKDRLGRPDHADLDATDLIGFIVDDEWTHRENRKMTSLLSGARFKDKNACVENIDYRASRGLKKTTILELAQNQWIANHENIAITGPSGVGKSYLAQALGHHACRAGHRVAYIRLPKLLYAFVQARAEGSYAQYLKKLSQIRLLIIDDLGVAAINDEARRDLLEVIEDRYDCGSTILTSQLPTSAWHEYIGGGYIADAICDRLLHNCHRLELKCIESIRKERSSLSSKKPA